MKLHGFALLAALAAAGSTAMAQSRSPAPVARAAPRNVLAPRSTLPPLRHYRVATTLVRPLCHGCTYRSTVRGTLDARGATVERVHDADLRTRAVVACNGRVVSGQQDHVRVPFATVAALNDRVSKGLTASAPGQNCRYASALRIAHGRVTSEAGTMACKLAATAPAPRARVERRPTLSDMARFGAH